MEQPNTLIIGATGKTGRAIVQKYSEEGQLSSLRLAVRSKEDAQDLFGPKVALHTFDYTDSFTWIKSLEGIEKVYMIAPPKGTKAVFQGVQWIDFMKQHAVRKVVFLSGGSTGDIPGSLLNELEQCLQSSKLGSTILRPGWFMQNFIHWYGDFIRDEQAIYLPAGDSLTAFVDVDNIADVVYYLFHARKNYFDTLRITSDEAINHYRVAEIFSDVLGTKVQYMPLPDAEFVHAMSNRGWPESKAQKFVSLYQQVRIGKESKPSLTYENLLKKKPTSFRSFVEKHRNAWIVKN